jgi:exportin-5
MLTRSQDNERSAMETNLQTWCENLLEIRVQDPLIQRRIIQVSVEFSTTALEQYSNFMLKVLEHILTTRAVDEGSNPAYLESVKLLQQVCAKELQRLAYRMPDQLLDVYPQLEAKVRDIVENENPDDRRKRAFYSFLFIVTHRARNVPQLDREARLQEFLAPITLAWKNPELSQSLSTFQGFCNIIGLGRAQEYLVSRRVHAIEDWAAYQLDAEGMAIQAELSERIKVRPASLD